METQTLEQIYFIGQTISAIAVVLSLIYVGFQIKQSTTATQTASAQAYISDIHGIVGLINSSPNLADVLHKGASGLSSLEGGDLIRFMSYADLVFITYQSLHLQWQKGTLDKTLLDIHKQTNASILQHEGNQDWWKLRRHWFNPEFQNYIDEIIAEGSAAPINPGSIEGRPSA